MLTAATHTHSAFGFAGMFLLRMGQYFPDAIDYPRVIQLTTALVETLSQSEIGPLNHLKQRLTQPDR